MAKAKKHLHEKRQLTFAELGALLGARALLASGSVLDGNSYDATFGEHVFCMRQACIVQGCGSVSCIGGTMAQIMGMNEAAAKEYVFEFQPHSSLRREGGPKAEHPLSKLFFPPGDDWTCYTAKVAVKAIDNFLETGRPKWREAVALR